MVKKNKKGFFRENYSRCFSFLGEIKNFIWFSIIVFLLFILIGYFFPVFFRKEIIDLIVNLMDKIKDYNMIQMIGYIIANNSWAAVISVVFGILFGIIPLGTIVFNGYLLGFVANYAVSQGGLIVLWKIFPHGIFELPAIILAVSMGIKLGTNFFRKDSNKIFRKDFGDTMRVFIFIIIPLLIIAGIIEGSLIFLTK